MLKHLWSLKYFIVLCHLARSNTSREKVRWGGTETYVMSAGTQFLCDRLLLLLREKGICWMDAIFSVFFGNIWKIWYSRHPITRSMNLLHSEGATKVISQALWNEKFCLHSLVLLEIDKKCRSKLIIVSIIARKGASFANEAERETEVLLKFKALRVCNKGSTTKIDDDHAVTPDLNQTGPETLKILGQYLPRFSLTDQMNQGAPSTGIATVSLQLQHVTFYWFPLL